MHHIKTKSIHQLKDMMCLPSLGWLWISGYKLSCTVLCEFHLGVNLLGHMVTWCLFYKAIVAFWIPASSVWVLFHILTSAWYCCFALFVFDQSSICKVVSHCDLNICNSWGLVMLSLFSCTYLPFMYILCGPVWNFCPLFFTGLLVFLLFWLLFIYLEKFPLSYVT